MKKIAVILSGCGFKDGAEITESVSTLIALSENQVDYKIFAPNISIETTNHIDDSQTEARNLLTEAARIARGEIADLETLNPNHFDGIVFPGGFGAALHLCDFAKKGADCQVLPKVESIIRDFHSQSKPICATCIAPALIAKVLGDQSVTVTIGNDQGTAAEIEKTGAHHENCAVSDYVSDRATKVITTPAYMYEAKPIEVFIGIRKAIKEFVEMA